MKKHFKKKERIEIAILGILAFAVILIPIVFTICKHNTEAPEENMKDSPADYQVTIKEKERFVEVEKKISASVVEDGLRDMGFLVTQEYYFTEVVTNEKEESVLWGLLSSTASYSVKYDGSVFAGVDFSRIQVSKIGDRITVTAPVATVQSVDIDFNSFELLSNKDGLWTHMNPKDYNDSLKALKLTAENKAGDRGILEKAEANAEKIIRQFVAGIAGDPETEIRIDFTLK